MNPASVLRAELRSVRFRVLATLLAFMAVGLFISGAVSHAVELGSLNDRVNQELLLPAGNLRQLANQAPPGSGAGSYTSLDELFTTFLHTGAPGGYESVMTIVRSGDTIMPSGDQPTNLNTRAVVKSVWDRYVPGETVLHDMSIDGRTVRLAITSVSMAGQPGEGVLVASSEIGLEREQVLGSMWIYAAASVATLLTAAIVGYLVMGRLLSPIRRLREATENTTSEDLTKRVPVPSSNDDVAQLAMNFNHMLERLETGFANQRRFVDDSSHELRTPLTIIRGNLELLRTGDPDDVEQTRTLLLDELDRMQLLVDDLLVLARSGRPDFISPGWIDADVFVEDAMHKIRVLGARRWEIDSKPGGLIRADRRRLTQAIEQLAANAVAFTGEDDRISLGAAWVETDDDGGSRSGVQAHLANNLEIWVADTGSGIPPEEHERIFERFARSRTQAGTDGSGLGLSIVKAIAEAHGGTLRVESAAGEGSMFVLSIPSGGGDSGPDSAGLAKGLTGGAAAGNREMADTGGAA